MDDQLRIAALEYHRLPKAGKISVTPTKGLINQRDLALAYSPGVAAACDAIVADPDEARSLTSRGNLVAVITNGTAVLGLGNIGPLAGKPVMEGKACLFKKFSGIDVFDIEIAETDPEELVKTIARLEPTFGGINLEDIKAPDCFYVERKLRERMKIPVFHDDQHGTAIVAGAAMLNDLKVVGKDIATVRLVCSGAGAAAIACLDLMVGVGLKHENIVVCDSKGVIFAGPRNADGGEQGALRLPHVGAHARRCHRRRGHLPRALRSEGADAGHGEGHGARPADPRARESGARDPAGAGEGRAPRRHHRHGPFRLPEPGEQRPVLSVHLPRCAGRGRHVDHRGDEARLHARDRRARARRAVGHRRPGLRGRGPRVRARIPDSEALRSAAHGDRAAGGGEGRDGQRRGHAADRGFRRVPRAPVAIHLSLEPDHETGVRRRQAIGEARRVRRGRGGARAARGPGRRRRRAGEARADRPPRGHRRAHREVRACACAPARTSSSSTSTATRAIASAGSSTTS